MKPHAIDCGCLDCLAENAKDIGKQLDAPLVGMTNQEAMRGKLRDKLFRFEWENFLRPTTDEIVEFASQEVASRDARIEKLEAAAKAVTSIRSERECTHDEESWYCVSCKYELETETALAITALREALKEQP